METVDSTLEQTEQRWQLLLFIVLCIVYYSWWVYGDCKQHIRADRAALAAPVVDCIVYFVLQLVSLWRL